MKKSIVILAVLFFTNNIMAQVNIGFQVGGNMANVKEKSEYPNDDKWESKYKSRIGFLVGAVMELSLSDNLLFRPELNFVQKGFKDKETMTTTEAGVTYSETTDGTVSMNFIELPVNIIYMMPAGSGRLFFGAGPSFGFGISGKYEGTYSYTISGGGGPTTSGSQTRIGDVKFDGKKYQDLPQSDKDLHYKSLDLGINILAGYAMSSGIYFNVGYTHGLSNLNPNQYESSKTSGFQLKVGYMLSGKSKSVKK